MGKLKAKILAWLADDTPESTPAQATTSTAPSDIVPVQASGVYGASSTLADEVQDNSDNEQDTTDDAANFLHIHKAPAAMIDYWHAYGSNGFLQNLLREYNLDFFHNVQAYNHFKIGMNESAHEVTFALDDEHYCSIPFNAKHTAPLDRKQAYRVLEFINQLREETHWYEDFCGVMIERFD